MKNLKKLSALLLATMISIPGVFSQERKSSENEKVEGKVKVFIVKDENGNVEKHKQEFNLEDEEALEKYLKEKGVKLDLKEMHQNAKEEGNQMRIELIKESDEDGVEGNEKVMIMQYKNVGDAEMEFNQDMDMNWISDSSDGNHKIIRFKSPAGDTEFENVFIFDDESIDGKEIKHTKSFIFIKKDHGDSDDNYETGITEEKLIDMPIEKLKMYPNPNDGNFSTEFLVTEPSDVLINIIDSKGALIYEKELNNFSGIYKEQVDLSKEDSGLYFYNLKIGDKVKSNKIILQ